MTPSLAAFINSLLLGLFIVVIPVGTAVFLVSQSDRVTRNQLTKKAVSVNMAFQLVIKISYLLNLLFLLTRKINDTINIASQNNRYQLYKIKIILYRIS